MKLDISQFIFKIKMKIDWLRISRKAKQELKDYMKNYAAKRIQITPKQKQEIMKKYQKENYWKEAMRNGINTTE